MADSKIEEIVKASSAPQKVMIVEGRDRDHSASFGDEDKFDNDSTDEYYENNLIPNSSLDADDNEDHDDTASAASDLMT